MERTDRNLCLREVREREFRLYMQGQKSEHNPELDESLRVPL